MDIALASEHRAAFLLAGCAILTLESQRTGRRYTYRVDRAAERKALPGKPWIWFLSLLTGPNNQADYTYLGVLSPTTGRISRTKASPQGEIPALTAAAWAFGRMLTGRDTPGLAVYHAGFCGRCGALLTKPESIAVGLGPVCRELA